MRLLSGPKARSYVVMGISVAVLAAAAVFLAGHFHESDHIVVRPDGETFSFTRQVEAQPA